ncbi:MAG: DUF523 and DUF1722 domain-containing protein [Halanaerobiales bacterium]
MEFVKPKIVISKCLGFEPCYYNGQIFNIDFIDKLSEHVEFQPVCPEIEIGLGVPRQTIRIVRSKDNKEELRLIQPKTERDLTEKMNNFSKEFLNKFDNIDGFVFKERSPSCGPKKVKIYSDIQGQVIHQRGIGFFAQKAIELFPFSAVEGDGRLNNLKLREHFLTKLFTFAKFRKIKETQKMKNLVKFHTDNKYLLMAYNQNILKEMGRIVANHENHNPEKVYNLYKNKLIEIFKEKPNYRSILNVLSHIFGYFKNELTSNEKEFFLTIVDKYRENKVPLSVPIHVLKAWIIEYDIVYLKNQSFIDPFPDRLVDLTDSGKKNKKLR